MDSYEYVFVGGDFNAYSFSTENKIRYQVKFVPSDYLFDAYVELGVRAFEMVIAVADNPTGSRLPADRRIYPTIVAIFYDFFQSEEQVVVFICDTADNRQSARARKFTAWFYDDVRPNLAKFDMVVPDGKRFAFISMILHNRHPHRSQVVETFFKLGESDK